MKAHKLTVKEITELQPTRVDIVGESRTVVGGLELHGEYDENKMKAAVKKHFGDDCKPQDSEPDDGDGCLHVVVYAKL